MGRRLIEPNGAPSYPWFQIHVPTTRAASRAQSATRMSCLESICVLCGCQGGQAVRRGAPSVNRIGEHGGSNQGGASRIDGGGREERGGGGDLLPTTHNAPSEWAAGLARPDVNVWVNRGCGSDDQSIGKGCDAVRHAVVRRGSSQAPSNHPGMVPGLFMKIQCSSAGSGKRRWSGSRRFNWASTAQNPLGFKVVAMGHRQIEAPAA